MFNGEQEGMHRGITELMARRVAPNVDWSDIGSSEHFVQFYESDGFIVMAVAEYLIHGFKSGETCIVAATGEHLTEIERIITAFGFNLEAARAAGRYISLDAVETLSKFMVRDMPDAARFAKVIGGLVKKAVKSGTGIRIFGEMVSVLCLDGNYAAAIALEKLWNGLRDEHPFTLFCGYPLAEIKHESPDACMQAICSSHAHVIPSESYTALTNSNERLQKIAFLQQRNKQLVSELAELQSRIASRQVVVG